MLEEAIVKEIKNDSTLASRIDAGGGRHHIYPLRVPTDVDLGETGAIIYTEITQSNVYPSLRISVYQLTCISRSYDEALKIAGDIDRIFDDLSETKLGGEFGVKYVKFNGRSALFDEGAELYTVPVDIFIKH